MATTRKPATAAKTPSTRKPATPKEAPVVELTEEQRQAKIQAYAALRSASLPIPDDIRLDVEKWIKIEEERRAVEQAEIDKAQAAYDEANEKGPWYVRNLYRAPQSLRLDRQTEKRRIELKPRGVPGDMHPLQDGDLEDPILKLNLTQGQIEVIPAGEARYIISKQMTNINEQGRVHPIYQMLRRPDGKKYENNPVKIEAEFNSQGVTVAANDPRWAAGQMTDKELKQTGGLQRTQPGHPRETVSTFVPTGGNPAIISDGFSPQMGGTDPRTQIADDIARRRGDQAASEYRQGLAVTVAPVQRS